MLQQHLPGVCREEAVRVERQAWHAVKGTHLQEGSHRISCLWAHSELLSLGFCICEGKGSPHVTQLIVRQLDHSHGEIVNLVPGTPGTW